MNEWIVWGYPAQVDLGHLLLLFSDVVLSVAFVVLLMRLQKLRREKSASTIDSSVEKSASDQNAKGIATVRADTASAMQMLAMMQKEARLIDFFMQPVDGYSDADVASAARVIHAGGQKIFKDYIQVEPVRSEPEEATVTVEAGFNPQEVRLVGRVSGQAPFRGVLIHKGWRVKQVTLPQLLAAHDIHILAPAEVEL